MRLLPKWQKSAEHSGNSFANRITAVLELLDWFSSLLDFCTITAAVLLLHDGIAQQAGRDQNLGRGSRALKTLPMNHRPSDGKRRGESLANGGTYQGPDRPDS